MRCHIHSSSCEIRFLLGLRSGGQCSQETSAEKPSRRTDGVGCFISIARSLRIVSREHNGVLLSRVRVAKRVQERGVLLELFITPRAAAAPDFVVDLNIFHLLVFTALEVLLGRNRQLGLLGNLDVLEHLFFLVFPFTLEIRVKGFDSHAALVVKKYVDVPARGRIGARDKRDDHCKCEGNGQRTPVRHLRNPLKTGFAAGGCVDGLMVVDPGELCILRLLGKLHGIYLLMVCWARGVLSSKLRDCLNRAAFVPNTRSTLAQPFRAINSLDIPFRWNLDSRHVLDHETFPGIAALLL